MMRMIRIVVRTPVNNITKNHYNIVKAQSQDNLKVQIVGKVVRNSIRNTAENHSNFVVVQPLVSSNVSNKIC